MITISDAMNTIDIGKYYAILPTIADKQKYIEYYAGKEVTEGFSYNSGQNDDWVSTEEMRGLIVKYVDSEFKPIS